MDPMPLIEGVKESLKSWVQEHLKRQQFGILKLKFPRKCSNV
uniref:Uncharacterized protein n=1 Tax=Rhizophora mucronata TaxID=61149 RepID=A0A2P2PXL3_RHIMU